MELYKFVSEMQIDLEFYHYLITGNFGYDLFGFLRALELLNLYSKLKWEIDAEKTTSHMAYLRDP